MQELRSSEILDKEIHLDAVKKAEKIIKKADADCEALLASIDSAVEKDQSEKKEFYAKKLAAFEKDLNASVPLEKERFEVSFIQNQITKGINAYFASKKESERIEIVTKSFDFNVDKKIKAYVYGFDNSTVEKFLTKKVGKNLLSCQETKFGKIVPEEDFNLQILEGIILEAEDKSFRCRLTISEVVGQLLDKNRAELSDALFGGQA